MSMVFTPDLSGIAHITTSPTGPTAVYLLGRGKAVAELARASAPRKSGKLAANIRVSVVSGGSGFQVQVLADVDYAIYVAKPTRPHTITPRKRKVLRFPSKGGVVFASSVQHPGTRGDTFMEDALVTVFGGV